MSPTPRHDSEGHQPLNFFFFWIIKNHASQLTSATMIVLSEPKHPTTNYLEYPWVVLPMEGPLVDNLKLTGIKLCNHLKVICHTN